MDLRSCCKCNSGSSDGEAVHLSRSSRGGSSTSSSLASTPAPSRSNDVKQRWRELWIKLKKEKSRVPAESSPVPYDFYNYSQNFDQGIAWDEPENVSRSFSVRFADPASRVVVKKRVVK